MGKVILFFIIGLCCFSSGYSQVLSWKILHPKTGKWVALGEKGSVQEALINSKELPDPFYGDNEKLFAWIENYNWTFEAHIKLDSIISDEFYELDFPSIDTYGEVFVNGTSCGKGENAFVAYRFDVKSLLKVGDNVIRVIFTSPIAEKRKEAERFVYPAPNDAGSVKVAPYCRKPQYQFGWDWSLRMVTMGFWEPAQLVHFKYNRVIGANSVTREIADDKSSHSFSLFLSQTPPVMDFVWESKLFGVKTISPNTSKALTRFEEIENPKLWWPRGHGDQYLYEDEWRITTIDGTVIYHDTVKFGVRTSEIIQEKDQWGTSFQVVVNGRKIFCKGGDYIPDDIFPARISDEKLRKQVQTMAECNFNMVRIWGGGMYAQETFLEECDKLGIMVWHDFMFACAMYPGSDKFLENVRLELSQQVPRIASHPSLVLFNGNNEVDVAWKNWGFQDQYKISKKNQEIILGDYNRLFKELIPQAVEHYAGIPYEHTSPLSNWGNDEFYNHGTQHYWGVWHGKDPMSNMGTKIGRFNAEYGFQSFPEYSTLSTFSKISDWSLESAVMKCHQKSYVGNGMIAKHADLLFGKSKSFEEFVYFSQLTQAEAVETAVNAHRIDKPRCSGTLYWQVNDCWPAISWSSVDYYGNWKALQYRIRNSYEDVAILKDKTSPECRYFLVSDKEEFFRTSLQCEVLDMNGGLLETFICHRTVTTEPSVVFEEELKKYNAVDCIVKISYTDDLGKLNSFSDFHIVSKEIGDREQPKIIDLLINNDAKTGTVIIENEDFLLDFWIYSSTSKLHFENNFINLQSGKHAFRFSFEGKSPEKQDLKFMFR